MFTTLSITSLSQGNIHNRKSKVSALQAEIDEAAARCKALPTAVAPRTSNAAFLSFVMETLNNSFGGLRLVRGTGN